MRHRDPNNPSWLSQQTCWWCGKLGHIRQKCMASQFKKDAYRVAKTKGGPSANATSDEPDEYKALVAEEAQHGGTALVATGTDPKPWLIDSGCTGHFCLNKSQFVSYVPYAMKHKILLGDACSTPSIGEGTVRLTCIMGEKVVTWLIHNVQYVPGLKYGLLSCRALLHQGLKVVLENNACKVFHNDGTLIAESVQSTTQLFRLNTAPDNPTQLAVDQSANVAGHRLTLFTNVWRIPGRTPWRR